MGGWWGRLRGEGGARGGSGYIIGSVRYCPKYKSCSVLVPRLPSLIQRKISTYPQFATFLRLKVRTLCQLKMTCRAASIRPIVLKRIVSAVLVLILSATAAPVGVAPFMSGIAPQSVET
jgi:hypothetical protein